MGISGECCGRTVRALSFTCTSDWFLIASEYAWNCFEYRNKNFKLTCISLYQRYPLIMNKCPDRACSKVNCTKIYSKVGAISMIRTITLSLFCLSTQKSCNFLIWPLINILNHLEFKNCSLTNIMIRIQGFLSMICPGRRIGLFPRISLNLLPSTVLISNLISLSALYVI